MSTSNKTNAFVQKINKMAKSIGFTAKEMLKSFKEDDIRSRYFNLYCFGFKTRREFVQYCQDKKQLKLAQGKLIKLYPALIAEYRITGFCCNIQGQISNLFNYVPLVFISQKYTQQIIDDKIICSAELNTLDDAKRLYQYLKWTIRLNQINKFIKCFTTNKPQNNIQFLLINSELHDRNNQILYMFCTKNDIIKSGKTGKTQQWQLVKLVTTTELIKLVPDCTLAQIISQFVDDQDAVCCMDSNKISVNSIDIACIISQFTDEYIDSTILPLGARKDGQQFLELNQNRMMTKNDILYDLYSKQMYYSQLKVIQTGKANKKKNEKEVLQISLYALKTLIEAAAESPDKRHDLITIVSMLTGKKYGDGDYSVDQILPVYIDGNWVAICYRNGKPVMQLFDGYDITNKAILCNPTFDRTRLAFFKNNNIRRIQIIAEYQLNQLLSYRMEWCCNESYPESECASCASSTPQTQMYPENEQYNHVSVGMTAYPSSCNGNGEDMNNVTRGTSNNTCMQPAPMNLNYAQSMHQMFGQYQFDSLNNMNIPISIHSQQTNHSASSNVLKATAPEFIPMQTHNRSLFPIKEEEH